MTGNQESRERQEDKRKQNNQKRSTFFPFPSFQSIIMPCFCRARFDCGGRLRRHPKGEHANSQSDPIPDEGRRKRKKEEKEGKKTKCVKIKKSARESKPSRTAVRFAKKRVLPVRRERKGKMQYYIVHSLFLSTQCCMTTQSSFTLEASSEVSKHRFALFVCVNPNRKCELQIIFVITKSRYITSVASATRHQMMNSLRSASQGHQTKRRMAADKHAMSASLDSFSLTLINSDLSVSDWLICLSSDISFRSVFSCPH